MIEKMNAIKEKFIEADAILIGASNGLSISEGLHLFADNEIFRKLFGDMKEKYGIRCILQGMAYDYRTEEEKWAFWSRLIHHFVLRYEVSPQMRKLKEIVGEKPYFIITSNGETHFETAGFETERIYEIEGNLIEMQCEQACHKKLYPVNEMITAMHQQEIDGKVPTKLIPKCPICGGNMRIHSETWPGFIRDTDSAERYMSFVDEYYDKKLVILELGIGMRNQLIKAPLMRLAANSKNSTYITINKGEVYVPDNIMDKSYGLNGDLTDILMQF